MNEFLKIIAVISGLFAIMKGGLDIFKQYRTSSEELSKLWRGRRFRIAATLTIVGFILIVSALWFIQRDIHGLNVQIYNVSFDEKGSLVASERFTTSQKGKLTTTLIQEAGQWIMEQISPKDDIPPENINIHVNIPADLSKDTILIETTPSVDVKKCVHIFEGNTKYRSERELEDEALANLGKDFTLEIRPSGYKPVPIEVTWGEALDRNYTSSPMAVSIGIEKFTGEENSFGIKLADFLMANSRFSIKEPDSLDRLQKKIAEQKAVIASQPFIQMELRESLGLDYIISGNYEIE